jgi:hypothetical protein
MPFEILIPAYTPALLNKTSEAYKSVAEALIRVLGYVYESPAVTMAYSPGAVTFAPILPGRLLGSGARGLAPSTTCTATINVPVVATTAELGGSGDLSQTALALVARRVQQLLASPGATVEVFAALTIMMSAPVVARPLAVGVSPAFLNQYPLLASVMDATRPDFVPQPQAAPPLVSSDGIIGIIVAIVLLGIAVAIYLRFRGMGGPNIASRSIRVQPNDDGEVVKGSHPAHTPLV